MGNTVKHAMKPAVKHTMKRCNLQRFVMGRTEAFRSSKNPRLGATGPPRQTWHEKRIPRQAKTTKASMVPGAFQHVEPIKHTNSTCALQEIGCSNPNMGAETLRKSVQDLRPFMGLRIMNYTKRSAIALLKLPVNLSKRVANITPILGVIFFDSQNGSKLFVSITFIIATARIPILRVVFRLQK